MSSASAPHPHRSAPTRARAIAVAAGLGSLALLAGCGGDDHTATVDGQEFTGPWAADIAYFWSSYATDFSHAALADSRVTDLEREEGAALIAKCYADSGAEVTYDAYGFETVDVVSGNADPSEVMGRCSFADGGVVALHDKMTRNPQNLDDMTIVAECLVEAQVVEPGFTGDDYEEVLASGRVPWLPTDERVERCAKDPLGFVTGATDSGR